MENVIAMSSLTTILILVLSIILIWRGIRVVPQSRVFIVERFGKYTKTLAAGLNFIVPFLDVVRHKISILERQLPEFKISVITKDNVEVVLEATVFYRIVEAASSVYRIEDVDNALHTSATSIIRSAAGRLELDALQSSRESMNTEIAENLQIAAKIWGVEVTRTEITDVIIDDTTKDAQRQQLNAERQRRAAIAEAEGDKRSKELAADAQLYTAQKEAEAVRVRAEADAYAIEIEAKANAEQTRLLAQAISENGQPAINFEIMKRQVEGLSQIASSENSKTVIVPTDITGVIGSIQTILETLKK
ncbi:MAG: SPFH domain-containing protein [Rhodospirillales bacterium]|nr:SPFH domain-containing protein [Rhodospirillales bacterium]